VDLKLLGNHLRNFDFEQVFVVFKMDFFARKFAMHYFPMEICCEYF